MSAAELQREYVAKRGHWSDELQALAEVDPGVFRAVAAFEASAMDVDVLTPKTKSLVQLAVDASVSRLNVAGVARHIKAARAAGATNAEIMEVCMLAAVLGVHSVTLGYPILLEELEALGRGEELRPPLNDKALAIKARFSAKRGYWTERWEALLKGAPEYFEAYTDFSTYPWEHGTLPPKEREFMYIAIDASTNHLHQSGLRLHTQNALRYGATAAEIVAVLTLTSLVSLDTCTLGASVIQALDSQK